MEDTCVAAAHMLAASAGDATQNILNLVGQLAPQQDIVCTVNPKTQQHGQTPCLWDCIVDGSSTLYCFKMVRQHTLCNHFILYLTRTSYTDQP
eukprot:361393-Chlamydomonas_euryale.AAC.2